MSDVVKKAIVRRLDQMSEAEQRRVLDFTAVAARPGIDRMSDSPPSFVGTISLDDLRIMEQVIDEECERIESYEEFAFDGR